MKFSIITKIALVVVFQSLVINFFATNAFASNACKAKQAIMKQRCNRAKSRPSTAVIRACASATNSYNKCLARPAKPKNKS
jgi:hypothetical protein